MAHLYIYIQILIINCVYCLSLSLLALCIVESLYHHVLYYSQVWLHKDTIYNQLACINNIAFKLLECKSMFILQNTPSIVCLSKLFIGTSNNISLYQFYLSNFIRLKISNKNRNYLNKFVKTFVNKCQAKKSKLKKITRMIS